jgi:hypothetical protein
MAELDLTLLRRHWLVENLGDLYITPGLVDLNVHCEDNFEGLSKSAAAGGVTTVAVERPLYSQSFCDIAPLTDYRSSPDPEAFGVRVKVDSSTSIAEALSRAARHNLPTFVSLDWDKDETPLHVLSPYRATTSRPVSQIKEFFTESDSDSEDSVNSPEDTQFTTPETTDTGALRRSSLKVPTYVKPFSLVDSTPAERKRVSLPNILGFNSHPALIASPIKPLSQLRRFTAPQVPAFPEDLFKSSREEYAEHLLKHSAALEHSQVLEVVRAPCRPVHICSLSSAQSFSLLQGAGVTCDSAASFLYFNETNIKPGDTRFKSAPPIRDRLNQTQLLEGLERGLITCVSSFHRSVAPALKFLGDFKSAPNGLNVLGCSLQAMWTLLCKAGCTDAKLVQLCVWTSITPAAILGLSSLKGSLTAGKHADLVVWNPFERSEVMIQNPETCAFKGEQMWGRVHRTYLRGHLVYCNQPSQPAGITLSRLSLK